jgi:hypothetical protein
MVTAAPASRRCWHHQFLALLPQIVTRAKIAFRHLKPEARAEMVEEVVCNAMQAFVRLVQLKKTDIAYSARWPGSGSSKPVTTERSAGI